MLLQHPVMQGLQDTMLSKTHKCWPTLIYIPGTHTLLYRLLPLWRCSAEAMGLSSWLLRAIKRKGFRLPTPIQRKAMPHILQGLDVIGMARTGSGKTAAFVIPMLERLKAHSLRAGARAVILSPTRELALQTNKVVRELAKGSDLRTAVLVGGDAMEAQFAELAQNPDILIATPGRLLHHLLEVEGMSLSGVEYCVFDEADRLFEMGFADQVCVVCKAGREEGA